MCLQGSNKHGIVSSEIDPFSWEMYSIPLEHPKTFNHRSITSKRQINHQDLLNKYKCLFSVILIDIDILMVMIIIIILFATRVLIKLCIYYLNGKDEEVSYKSLARLLKTLNLEKYEQVLKEAGVTDLETFTTLSDIDLKDTIGITLLGPRRKMTSAIEKLRVTSFYLFFLLNVEILKHRWGQLWGYNCCIVV